MRSYIKLFGPKIDQALTELEKLTEELSHIDDGRTIGIMQEEKKGFLSRLLKGDEDKRGLIGEYDYEIIWAEEPTVNKLLEFIKKIDDIMESIGARYSINSVPEKFDDMKKEQEDDVVSYINFIGPSITKALGAVHEVVLNMPQTKDLEEVMAGEITIGEYDYAFGWGYYPSVDQIRKIISAIDEAIGPTGALYTITTKSRKETRPITSEDKRKTRQVAARHKFKKDYQEVVGQFR